MAKQRCAAALFAVLLVLAGPVRAQTATVSGPNYALVSESADSLELEFHYLPLRAVHADDSQNALVLDFDTPVNGALFDRLANDLPQWIAQAYAGFDDGVIRTARPVTFLIRPEPNGFSLKLIARGPPPPPRPVALRGEQDDATSATEPSPPQQSHSDANVLGPGWVVN